MNGERIRLTLRALPDSLPVAQRLRLALKTLLRRDRLQCLKVEFDADDDRRDGSQSKADPPDSSLEKRA